MIELRWIPVFVLPFRSRLAPKTVLSQKRHLGQK